MVLPIDKTTRNRIEAMYYEANLSRLRDCCPQLANRVETTEEKGGLCVIRTLSGSYTVRVSGDKEKEVYLHSKYNPRLEASHLIKRIDVSTQKTWFLIGLGLGYGLFSLIERINEKSDIVVIEKRIDLFKYSLTLFDWSNILHQGGKVRFIIGEGIEDSNREIKKYFPDNFQRKFEILEHKPSIRLYPQYYSAIIKKLQFLVENRKENIQKIRSIIEEDYGRIDRLPNFDLHPQVRDKKSYFRFYEDQGRKIKRGLNTNNRILDALDCAEGNCLDVGCQAGSFTIMLAREKHQTFGVDISHSYLEQAASLLKGESEEIQNRIIYIQAWGESLPFKDERFQTVLLGEILEHVIEPRKLLKEVLRVLRTRRNTLFLCPCLYRLYRE